MNTVTEQEIQQKLYDILAHYVRFDGTRVIWLTPVFDLLVQQRVYLALLCMRYLKMEKRITDEARTPLQIATMLNLPENNSSIRVSLLRLRKDGLAVKEKHGYVAGLIGPLSKAKRYP